MNFDTMLMIESNRSTKDLSEYYQRVLSSDVPDICYSSDVMSEALDIPLTEARQIMDSLDSKGYSQQLNEVMKTRVNKNGKISYTSAYKKIRDGQSKTAKDTNLGRLLEKRVRFFERVQKKKKKEIS